MNNDDKSDLLTTLNFEAHPVEHILYEALENVQRSAYELGLERGCKDRQLLIQSLEDAACALCDAGLKSAQKYAEDVLSMVV